MTKEELEKEAGKWLRKYLLCCNCEKKCNCIDSNSYCEEQVLKAYVDSAEPREKRIEELIALINAERERQEKCDDVHLRKIAELEKENAELKEELEEADNATDCFNRQEEIITKAKELLRYYFDCFKNDNKYTLSDFEVVEDTEQFLSEVEK